MNRKFLLGWMTLVAAFGLCAAAACDDGETAQKRIPVYQGMSIEKTVSTVSNASVALSDAEIASNASSVAVPLAAGGNPGDSGNHNGWYKDKDKEIDQDDPFGGADVEDAARDSLKVEGAAQKIYYAVPNEDIFITIHIDNPDSFEIMSFTLNGEKYSSYMFEAGSNMENLILKKNVGEVSGIVEYTIDAIKYVDGTEIKDVLIDGDKTVRAGVKTEGQVGATVEATAGFDEISLDISVKDRDGLIAYSGGALKAVLFDGEALVAERDIEVGESEVTFGGLELATLYQYAVVACYDDLSSGPAWHVLSKEALHTETALIFDDVSVTKSAISFSFLWHEDATPTGISSLRLIDGGKERALDSKETSVEGLLSGHAYTLAATYDFKGAEKEIKLDFATQANAVPTVEVTTSAEGQEEFAYTVAVTDTDGVGAISKVELLHGDDEPQSLGTSATGTAAQLLSNNDYTIRVTYTYNLHDGNGPQTIAKTAAAHTLAKATPTVELSKIERTTSEISFEVTLTDADGVSEFDKYELLEGETAAKTVTDAAEKRFGGLQPYTRYTVKVTYRYDLNDGAGEKVVTTEKSLYTLPVFEATGTSCINTSAVLEGGTIVLNTVLNNPCKAIVSEAKVNGIWYPADPATNENNLRVRITNEGQFRGGQTALTVEEVKAKIGEEDFTFVLTAHNDTTCFVNGNIEAISLKVVDENGKELEYAHKDETIYLQITFDNPTGYQIDSVLIYNEPMFEGEQIQSIDNNTIRIAERNVNCLYTMTQFSYSRGDVKKTKNRIELEAVLTVLSSSKDVVEIHAAADLKNMNEGKYYKLMNDIDLKDTPWDAPGDFDGYFDGGNFTIRNMRVVDEFKDQNVDLGLFKNAKGIIKDLNIENVLIVVNVEGARCYYGGIATQCNYLTVSNVHTSGDVSITASYGANVGGIGVYCYNSSFINCRNGTNISASSGRGADEADRVGGIAAYVETSTVTGCYNVGTISGQSPGSYIGGIVAYYMKGKCAINSCNNEGVIFGYNAGGIAGYSGISITNCYNTGSVSGYNNAAGIAGEAGGVEINGCYNEGDVTGGVYDGGITGFANNVKINGCYNTGDVSGNLGNDGGIAGSAYDTEINDCYNMGDVAGNGNVGGIAGTANDVKINDCYNMGNIRSAQIQGGGIIGFADYSNFCNGCFYIAEGKEMNLSGCYYGEPELTDCYHFSNGTQGTRVNSEAELIEKMRELFDETVWDFSGGDFPTLRAFAKA